MTNPSIPHGTKDQDMGEELKPFTEWFDRNVETGVRYSDNVIASLGPWSERREKFVRTIMEAAFYAGTNTRTPFEQAVREAVEAEKERCARIADGLAGKYGMQHDQDKFGYERQEALKHVAAAIRAPQELSE